jgi:hypothetical protein
LSLVQQDLNTANKNIFGYFAVNIQQNNHIHKKLLHFAVLFASLLVKMDHLQQEIKKTRYLL